MSSGSKKILILADHFSPGYKAGGPIQSLRNFCLLMYKVYDIDVVTRNTDIGETVPFEMVQSDVWSQNLELKVNVYYCSKKNQNTKSILALVSQKDYDYIYLNSLYSPVFSISILFGILIGKISNIVVLAPRGELNEGAIKIKVVKKKVFLWAVRIFGLHKRLIWHATTLEEEARIKAVFGESVSIKVANNIPKQDQLPFTRREKFVGAANFIMISRIAKIKNIDFALETFNNVQGQVNLDIIGPIEDNEYWNDCKKIIRALPKNVTVNHLGSIPSFSIPQLLNNYHFFLSPTKGENFGHSIFEALLAGLPILISKQTPWKNLTVENIGWDLSLLNVEDWESTINEAIQMPSKDYCTLSSMAWNYAKKVKERKICTNQLTQLFNN